MENTTTDVPLTSAASLIISTISDEFFTLQDIPETDIPTENPEVELIDQAMSISNTEEIIENIRVSVTEAQIVYILIGIFGMLGNGFSAALFLQNKGLRKNLTNHFLVSQSMLDFLAAFFLLATVPLGHLKKDFTGVAGYLRCILWDSSFAVWALFLSSTYNLVAVTLERYFMIVHPLHHKVYFTKSKAYAMMGVAWSTGVIFQVVLMFITGGVHEGSCFTLVFGQGQKARSVFAVSAFLIKYLIPIGIHGYCNYAIVLTLKKRQTINPTAKSKDKKLERAQRNIFKTLLLVVVAFVACVSWNQILFLIFNLGVYQIDFTSFSYHMSVSAYFINCCVNPIIYMAKYNAFKVALRALVCKNSLHPAESTVTKATSVV